jgi:GNAT superfamily N-acetyltransferase
MISDKLIIRRALPAEYEFVLAHYKICGYGGGLQPDDQVFIAVDEQLIGAVRICIENDIKVLRGMYLRAEFHRTGIGVSMLNYLAKNVDINGCYCLPYQHLVGFYGKIGFEEISPKDAPSFLAERLEKYRSNGNREITIMQIKNDI